MWNLTFLVVVLVFLAFIGNFGAIDASSQSFFVRWLLLARIATAGKLTC